MRLPEVVIAAAFACGIALGWHPAVARYAASYILLSSFFFLLSSFFFFSFFIFMGVLVLVDGARLEITCFVTCPGVANAAASAQAEAPDHKQDQEKE